jgi:hypothetical protein
MLRRSHRAIVVATVVLATGLPPARPCQGQPPSTQPPPTDPNSPAPAAAAGEIAVPPIGRTIRLVPGDPGSEADPNEIRVPPGGRDLTLRPEFQELLAENTLQSQSGANSRVGGATGGYIDSAVTVNRLLLRYDAAQGCNRPDRAEYFYPQNGPNRAGGQPLNFQQLTTYLEYSPLPNLSGFFAMPARWVHIPGAVSSIRGPGFHEWQPAQNFSGFSDLQLGFKYAFLADPEYYYTFQLRTYFPTGSGARGLGTAHASIEPGLLVYQRLTGRTLFLGQFEDWIPLYGSINTPDRPPVTGAKQQFAGNVLTYGAGLMYNAWSNDNYRAAPLIEFVGWTVLSGLQEVTPGNNQSAKGDTIVNMKVGMVFALGDYISREGLPPLNDRLNLYVGYGRALTGDVWYTDMFRLNLTWFY